MSMFFRQILHEDLGCASYVIASRGEAAVVDPKWEIGEYLQAAEDAGAKIRHVLETHLHADHVSGRPRLAAATGAASHLPVDPERPGARGLRDAEVLRVGGLDVRVIAAPGHRPEHLAYLVSDRENGGVPSMLLSGDSVLVGALARPDLAVDAVEGARALWGTVRRLVALGDRVQLWPGHVGASLCGGATLSEQTDSTIGHELRTNPMLSLQDADAFVEELTRAVPARPPRVERVVALNRRGAREPGPVRELDPAGLAQFVSFDVCVLDVRPPELFDQGHLAGAVNLPADGQGVGTRAGWATEPEEPIVIVSTTLETGKRVANLLYSAGVWNLAGVSVADPAGWAAASLDVRGAGALAPEELAPRLSAHELQLIDVRDLYEWRAGHVVGSLHLPLSELGDGRDAVLSPQRPVAVACASGRRAALAASVLRRRGHPDVSRVTGGIGDLASHGASLATGGR
jgi:hydroxyacylglutathione hydrolase